MKRYSKVGQTICKACTDSDLCAAICGPDPEFLCSCINAYIYIYMYIHRPNLCDKTDPLNF
jgi:hypothetical protein